MTLALPGVTAVMVENESAEVLARATRVLIAGGGTGGHVFPMLAVGQALHRVAPNASVVFVGTARGLEARAIPAAGEALELLDVAPLRGGGLRGFVRGGFKAVRSLVSARALVQRVRPDVVLSVGGYAGGPVALAARLMGVPLAFLEPNSVLGLTNKLLAPFAARAYFAFGDLDKRARAGVAARFGVPLRGSFTPSKYSAVAARMRVVLLGGSQGARALNESMPAAVRALLDRAPFASIVHQAGRGQAEATRARYEAAGVPLSSSSSTTELAPGHAHVSEFIDDVATELDRADLVVQRCGASSLAELCAVGRASVLVPFPFAADQHQLANAKSLEAEGAAIAMEQSAATPERLGSVLTELALDPARRQEMADRARALGKPSAAEDVARDLCALAHRGRP
ncbi:MAG: UDP-N-acetylglucosamine--N-acetylmuramyl-(pentapeptide) pyrophosphoryl-undecaprenol N-acetylglucosamine transferase [Polyangiaceae bacterium]